MVFTITLMSQLMTSSKADAAIGLIAKSKTTTTIGAISTGVVGGTYGLAALGAFSFNLGSAIVFALGVVTFGGLSLIVLDDKTIADLEFSQMDLDYRGYTSEEIQMYNAELAQLNAIRQTIQDEISEKTTIKESKKLWAEYKLMLHPFTVKIAEDMATKFTKNLKPINN